MKKLLLIELNEINFTLIKKYIDKYPEKFLNLRNLYNLNHASTYSEFNYHELEPWIQWVSIHTGKNYREHKIFRLGDMINSNVEQIFEKVEKLGFSVGVMSAMNAKNSLKNPSYFIPDPWTDTKTDGSFFSNLIKSVLVQTVNDNSQSKITLKSIFSLLIIFLRYMRIKDYADFIKLAISSIGKGWRKALFLDLLIHKIHLQLLKENNPNFSTVFLNAGAHIQHHYLFNSEFSIRTNPSWYINENFDPFREMLEIYETIIQDYVSMKNYELIFATGLSQKEYDKPEIYWRIKDHESFLKKLDLNFKEIHPRMTRDFLIDFDSYEDMEKCYKTLLAIKDKDEEKLFGVLDKRGNSLFATLTYPNDIKEVVFSGIDESIDLSDELVFVAIKNGEHSSNGEVFTTFEIQKNSEDEVNITQIYNTVYSYFRSSN